MAKTDQVKFVDFQIHLRFEYEDSEDVLKRWRKTHPPRNELYVTPQSYLDSAGKSLVIQSPTSHSTGEVTEDRCVLHTNFTNQYQDFKSSNDRFDYLSSKLQTLLKWGERACGEIQHYGFILQVRKSVDDSETEKVLNRLADYFGTSKLIGPQIETLKIYESWARTSVCIGNEAFLNVAVDWYQLRKITARLGRGQGFEELRIPVHLLPVSEEGIQFKYDLNNKWGLISGTEPSRQECESFLSKVLETAQTEIERLSEELW